MSVECNYFFPFSTTEPSSDLSLKSTVVCTPKEQSETGSPSTPTSVECPPTVPIVENGSI